MFNHRTTSISHLTGSRGASILCPLPSSSSTLGSSFKSCRRRQRKEAEHVAVWSQMDLLSPAAVWLCLVLMYIEKLHQTFQRLELHHLWYWTLRKIPGTALATAIFPISNASEAITGQIPIPGDPLGEWLPSVCSRWAQCSQFRFCFALWPQWKRMFRLKFNLLVQTLFSCCNK